MTSNRLDPFSSALFPFAAQRLHAHALLATSVLCGLDGPVELETMTHRVAGNVVLVRPHIHHQVKIGGQARILILNGLTYPFNDELGRPLSGPLGKLAVDATCGSEWAMLELRSRLQHRQASCPDDIVGVVRALSADPMSRMSQYELASKLGMERTRALRYFGSATGMTFRKFKLWLAVQNSARQLMQGDLVRNAALDNGFADSAHLSRTFKHMLGITPSDAVAGYRVSTGPFPGGL